MSGALVVLGGAGGIGRALVQAATERGWQVEIVDLDTALADYDTPAGAATRGFDVHGARGLEDALEGAPVQGFVNLAGFMDDACQVSELRLDAWRDVLDGNLTTAQRAASAMARRITPGGAMVNTGSGLGHFARPGYGAYAVAKAGVAALTRQLALELAPDIRVNSVAPSAVDTAFLRGGAGRGKQSQTPRFDIKAYGDNVPMGRIATPVDITGPILFLLSGDAAYITGQTLHVNGGAYMP